MGGYERRSDRSHWKAGVQTYRTAPRPALTREYARTQLGERDEKLRRQESLGSPGDGEAGTAVLLRRAAGDVAARGLRILAHIIVRAHLWRQASRSDAGAERSAEGLGRSLETRRARTRSSSPSRLMLMGIPQSWSCRMISIRCQRQRPRRLLRERHPPPGEFHATDVRPGASRVHETA